MANFIPGLELSRAFYHEAVRPILDMYFPGLVHGAALIGPGSEVLGFDDETSTDHCWGPRLQLFLHEADHASHAHTIHQALAQHLPPEFHGYSTHFSLPDPHEPGTWMRQPAHGGPVNHRVEVRTVRSYVREVLGFDLDDPLEPADWLTFPSQKLLALTAGAVYKDAVGLGAMRECFAWYPHDVWLLLMAAGWQRIGQEEHLMGRAGSRGDEIGSALIGARLVRDVMRLVFLMAQQYAPYPKWFETAFARLEGAADVSPHLSGALQAASWEMREDHLAAAYEWLARRHNDLGLTEPLSPQVTGFHDRPFRVIGGEHFTQALLARITDPAVRALANGSLIGSVDQFSDNTDLLASPALRPALRGLYDG